MAGEVMAGRKGKALICKVGLDGHESGAKLVARVLVDAGYEVVYTGRRQTVAGVVATSEQEDVDVIGVSLLSGTHLTVAADLMRALTEAGNPPPVVMGGIIPPSDYDELFRLGIFGVLGPGSSPQQILALVGRAVSEGGHSDAEVASAPTKGGHHVG